MEGGVEKDRANTWSLGVHRAPEGRTTSNHKGHCILLRCHTRATRGNGLRLEEYQFVNVAAIRHNLAIALPVVGGATLRIKKAMMRWTANKVEP